MIRTVENGPVDTWTLSRFERRNALSLVGTGQLIDLASSLKDRAHIRVVVIRGEEGAFCAGSDLKELVSGTEAEAAGHESHWGRLAEALADAEVPIIAAIEGPALGVGLFLASFCDIRLAAADAVFGLPEVSLGWFPPGGVEELIEIIGPAAVRYLLMSNQRVDAADALRLGLVDAVEQPERFEDALQTLTATMAAIPRNVAGDTKRYFSGRRDRRRAGLADYQFELFRSRFFASETWLTTRRS